tara:strand:- start:170 stop:520 length:351 start_codon:yes stop_codon:yes gene_type:complete
MIWYTYKASENVVVNQFVQLSSDGASVELHQSGNPLGVCVSSYVTEDTQERFCEIYVAGGSGQDAVLGADWNGSQCRFDVVQSKIIPVSSGGIGWIIPSFPQNAKNQNDVVKVAIY